MQKCISQNKSDGDTLHVRERKARNTITSQIKPGPCLFALKRVRPVKITKKHAIKSKILSRKQPQTHPDNQHHKTAYNPINMKLKEVFEI